MSLIRDTLGHLPYRSLVGAACAGMTAVCALLLRLVSWASGADAEYAGELAAARAQLELDAAVAAAAGDAPKLGAPRGRGRMTATAAEVAAAAHIPTEAELLASPEVHRFDASLAGTMAEGVHADALVRAALGAAKARAAVAATGLSLKCVRTGLATTAAGLIAITPGGSPTSAKSGAAAMPAAPVAAAAPARSASRGRKAAPAAPAASPEAPVSGSSTSSSKSPARASSIAARRRR